LRILGARHLPQDDTGTMRIAASVGDVPIYAKFMKPETA
jgi:hypothetical protein